MTTPRAHVVGALGATALLTSVLAPILPTDAARAGAPVTCEGRPATIVGTNGDDRLRGTAGADVIAGLGGDDVIRGLGGNDLICGGRNSDHLYGGPGDDRLQDAVGLHSAQHGGTGADRLDAGSTGAKLDGGPGRDVLSTGATKLARFRPEPGDDRVVSRRPALAILDFQRSPVGIHLDLARGVYSGRGTATVRIAAGSTTTVWGSRYDDVLEGGPLPDSLAGFGGDDVLVGHLGRDALTGGPGHNVLRGGGGRDWLADGELGQGLDRAYGGPGDDLLRFSSNDVVEGGPGADLVHVHLKVGATGTVDGGPGSNRLIAALVPRPSGTPWSHALVDLRTRRVVVDGHVLRFSGVFHRLDVKPGGARHWTLDGTPRADVIDSTRPAQRYPLVVHARGGPDVIETGGGDDVIWGGAGRDTVRAFKGTNTCHSVERDPDGTCTVSTP